MATILMATGRGFITVRAEGEGEEEEEEEEEGGRSVRSDPEYTEPKAPVPRRFSFTKSCGEISPSKSRKQ